MKKSYLKFVIVSLVVLLLSGCGGGGSDPVDTTKAIETINLSGKAVDSHPLVDSTVCLDLNKNNSCEADQEPTATTDNNGEYTLAITEAHQKNTGYSTAKIISTGGKNVSTGAEFIGTLSTLFDSDIRDNILLTPLSTLVALLKERNQLDREAAERQVASSFGLEVSQLSQDPLEALKNGDKAIFEANLRIQQSAQLIESQNNLKEMKDIFDAFTKNIADKKEFTDGLGDKEKIEILQKFINEELAKLTADSLAELNNDMRALIAVTQSVDRVEVGLRNETNLIDFNTTQYIVNVNSLGEEYIDGVYLDDTVSDINIVDLLAGKTVYIVHQHIIESSSFNADMSVMTWENVYGEGQEGQELGNKGTISISVTDNKVIVGGSDTFWVIEDNLDYIVITDGTDTVKSYKDLEKAKAYYESMKSGLDTPAPTTTDFQSEIAGKTFYHIDNELIKEIKINADITTMTVTTIVGSNTDGNGEQSVKFENNKIVLLDEDNMYMTLNQKTIDYLFLDFYSPDGIKGDDGRFYFDLAKAEADLASGGTTSTTTDFKSEIAGKTFYDLDIADGLIKEIKFNADITTISMITVVGSDTDGNGVQSIKFENEKVIFLSDNSYALMGEKTADYLTLLLYDSLSLLVDTKILYFDLAKAEADLTSATTPEIPVVAEDNSLSFNVNSSQALIAYDTPFSDIPAPSARRARVVGTTETVSNLLAIDETGVAKSAINSNYPVKVKYTVTSPSGASLFVVLDPFYTDTTGYDYSTAVALNNCAIYEVNVTSNSSVCVQEGVTVQDMDAEYIKMVGNRKPIQFDDNGHAYFLATTFGIENNTTTASGEKARLYMFVNNSSSAISQDNEDVHFFNTVPNGEVVYYKTITSSTETSTSLYIRHLDGSVARLTPDNVDYFTLDSNDVVAYSDTISNGIKLVRSLDGDKVQKTILDTTRYEGKSQNTIFADDGNLYSVFESVNSTTGMNQVKLYQVLPYDAEAKVVIDLGTDGYHSYSKTPIQVSKGYVYYSKVQEIFDTNGVSMGNASIIYIVRLSTGDSYELLNPSDNNGERIQLYNWRLSEKQLYFAGLNESRNVMVTGEIDINQVTRDNNPMGAITINDSLSQSAQLVDAKINDIEIVLPTTPPQDAGHAPQLINGIQLTPTNPHSASMEFSKYMDKASVEQELTYTSNGVDVTYMPIWIYQTLHLVPDLDGIPGDEHTTPMIENSEYTISLSNLALDLYDWEFNGATKTVTIIDITAPVITINGDINTTIYKNSIYTDAGAMATDDVDGSVMVMTTGNVDTSTVGTYPITYTATDSAGNQAELNRIVTVI